MNNIAKKTLERIEREQQKLEQLVQKKNEFTASYEAKLAEMNGGITKQEKLIASLRKQEQAEKLNATAKLADKMGISIDDLLSAVLKGDFYDLQDKIENGGSKGVSEPSVNNKAEDSTSEDSGFNSEEADADEYDNTVDEIQEETVAESGSFNNADGYTGSTYSQF